MNHRHDPIPFRDEYGRNCVRVPLDRFGRQYAVVTSGDYQRVRAAGAIGAWFLNDNGTGTKYVRTMVPAGKGRQAQIMPARIISGAAARNVVRYVNGNPQDLRPENIVLHRGKSKRNDSALAGIGAAAL